MNLEKLDVSNSTIVQSQQKLDLIVAYDDS